MDLFSPPQNISYIEISLQNCKEEQKYRLQYPLMNPLHELTFTAASHNELTVVFEYINEKYVILVPFVFISYYC